MLFVDRQEGGFLLMITMSERSELSVELQSNQLTVPTEGTLQPTKGFHQLVCLVGKCRKWLICKARLLPYKA